MSVTIATCRNCGKSDLKAAQASITLKRHLYCDSCQHSHDAEHNIWFCGFACLMGYCCDPVQRDKLFGEVAAFESGDQEFFRWRQAALSEELKRENPEDRKNV